MKNIKCILNLQAIFILILIVFQGCLKDGQSEGIKQVSIMPPLIIGIIFPASGPYEFIAQKHLAAIQATIKIAPVVAGRNVMIITRDSDGDYNTTIDAISKLANEGVAGIILIAYGNEAMELDRLYCPDVNKKNFTRVKIPVPVIIINSPDAALETCDGIWRLLPSSKELVQASLHFIKSTMKASRIAVILDSEENGSIKLVTMFSKEFINSGGTIVDIFNINEKESATRLSQLREKKPSLILIPNANKKTSEIAKLLRSNNIKAPVFFIQSPQDKEVFDSLREIEGIYLINDFSFQPTKYERCKRLLEIFSREKIAPETGSFISSDALFLLVDAAALPQNTKSVMIPLLSKIDNQMYLTGRIGLMDDGSVNKTVFVVKLNGSDTELIEEIKLLYQS
jgi:ABC-type branched-subunit amino acid transport system substrate-binding protein